MGKIENFGTKRNTKGFDKLPQNINKNGALKPISKILKELGEAKEIHYNIKIIDMNGQKDVREGEINSRSTLNEVIAIMLFQKALEGDLKAISEIMDRTEGKPKQVVETPDLTGFKINVNIVE